MLESHHLWGMAKAGPPRPHFLAQIFRTLEYLEYFNIQILKLVDNILTFKKKSNILIYSSIELEYFVN